MRKKLQHHLQQVIARQYPDFSGSVALERPKNVEHGDYTTNIALILGKMYKKKPQEVAHAIVEALPDLDAIERVNIAGHGFINVYLSARAKRSVIHDILKNADFGQSNIGQGKKVLLEFVSANPTGPLHVGHGRGAAYGASLGNILEKAGFNVYREYYLNDAGRQMNILALSLWIRYLHAMEVPVDFPKGAYRGAYVVDMAKRLKEDYGNAFLDENLDDFVALVGKKVAEERLDAHIDDLIGLAQAKLGEKFQTILDFALQFEISEIRDDLAHFRVYYDNFFSEKSLYATGAVEKALHILQEKGLLYEEEGALWFASSQFGDDKNRVVKRENGQYTYFAADIAYHLQKFSRGLDYLINVWGADHHGYIARLKAAIQALGFDPEKLSVALVQFAILWRHGAKIPMSTRAGEFVTLKELCLEVGVDAARFFYVLRKPEQHLDFDLDLAKAQSLDNPVYYVQYAHARICSVFAQWGGNKAALIEADFSPLKEHHEFDLCRKLEDYSERIELAASEYAPHHIAHYLQALAASLHSYYNAHQFLVADEKLKIARLALIEAVRYVLADGLKLLGVNAPEKM